MSDLYTTQKPDSAQKTVNLFPCAVKGKYFLFPNLIPSLSIIYGAVGENLSTTSMPSLLKCWIMLPLPLKVFTEKGWVWAAYDSCWRAAIFLLKLDFSGKI